MSRVPFEALALGGGFADDPRFAAIAAPPPPDSDEDPQARAVAEAYAAGRAEARAEAEAKAEADAALRSRLELACAKLDAAQQEELRRRLFDTVAALCECALAPLALDRDALERRVARAAAMLARADDERVLRLHPDDLELLGAQLPAGWTVDPDPALERGSLRIETQSGGVEDGPASWRRAIAEALAQC